VIVACPFRLSPYQMHSEDCLPDLRRPQAKLEKEFPQSGGKYISNFQSSFKDATFILIFKVIPNENESKMKRFLRKLNLLVMAILALIVFSTFFLEYGNAWRYLPVFKFHILESDKAMEIFVHGYLFDFNLGFFFQLFAIIFSLMIYFSIKRDIAFHLMYFVIITRNILILIQNSAPPEKYISEPGDTSVIYTQWSYVIFFSALLILNSFHDPKKRPRIPEPYEIIKD
jgi:hypothetical protein